MIYLPATATAATTLTVPTVANGYYVMPTVPAVYPRYGFVPQLVETSVRKEDLEKTQLPMNVVPPIQHVVHHHVQHSSAETCPGYDQNKEPWSDFRPASPPVTIHHHPQASRQSRRDQYELTDLSSYREKNLDQKIEEVRAELRRAFSSRNDKATETIDYYEPIVRPRSVTPLTVPYKEHYEVPRPRSRSRSASRHRSSSLPRDQWRPTSRNDYPWRDAHLPAYRDAALSRSGTPSKKTVQRDYVYRRVPDNEARRYYTETTGKNADVEVHQALAKKSATSYYWEQPSQPSVIEQKTVYSVKPVTYNAYQLKTIESTPHHSLYASNSEALHILPRQGPVPNKPSLKIINAPVTYLY